MRPGTFQSERDFRDRFCGPDKRTPTDPAQLRRLVADVMVRTTREQAGIDTVARHPIDVPIDLDPVERQAYRICVDVLRHVMTGDGDHFRRRSLAHRLTTSPRGLARSAAKLADNHPDPAVRTALRELADIGLDLGPGSRQRALLALVQQWINDPAKGKVIVFTQHTDTLEDLVRVLDQHGIASAIFHGGLAPSTRQAMIQRFRTKVPVLLSTDAGAEGLNLQFANCVVNYDLPWNPMRIEQRIGRVHRVTQTRDVYVANLYARGTVDELVYRILHDKLRMFELLFGQVTTILGEIEGDDGATFEARVLNAITADDDRAMQARLEQLGERIAAAFVDAQDQVQAGAHLGWMTDKRYRVDLPGRDATELMPSMERQERQRHRRAAQLVRSVIEQLGGEVVHEDLAPAPARQPAVPEFVSARFAPDAAEELQLPEELHLAFTSDALQRHRDAELCAVGSEIFDDLLDAVRDRGDLHATIASDVPLEALPEPPHRPSLRRVDVRVLGPIEWAAACHWRATVDNSETGTTFVTTYLGDRALLDQAADLQHRPELAQGAPPPATLTPVPVLLREILSAAHDELTPVLEAEAAAQRQRYVSEQQRQVDAYETRLADLASSTTAEAYEQAKRLRRAVEQLKAQRPPSTQLTAELISVELVGGGPVWVEELWHIGTDEPVSLTFEVDVETVGDADEGSVRYVVHRAGSDGHPIDVLDACADGHLVDHRRVRTCGSCGGRACEACGPAWTVRECACCGEPACGRCCPADGVCAVCSAPTREPDLDRPGQRAWRLGDRGMLWVSAGATRLDRPTGDVRHLVTTGEGAVDATPRLHAQLAHRGLPLDAAVAFEPAATLAPADLVLASVANHALHWGVDEQGGSTVAPTDRAALEQALDDTLPAVAITTANTVPIGMAVLLDRLRALAPVAELTVRVTGQVAARWVQLTPDGLSARIGSATGALAGAVTVEQEAAWQLEGEPDAPVAAARLGTLSAVAQPVHRSFLLDVTTPDGQHRRFLPSDDDCSLAGELVLDTVQRRLRRRPGQIAGLVDVLTVANGWRDALIPAVEPALTMPSDLAAPLVAALRSCCAFDAVEPGHQPVDGATLPAAFGAAGLDVHAEIGADQTTAYVIQGAGRCEAIHVAADQTTSWWSLDDDDPAARLAIGLAQLTGRGDVAADLTVHEPVSVDSGDPEARMTLRTTRRRTAVLTIGEQARHLELAPEPPPEAALGVALAPSHPQPLPATLADAGRRLITPPARAIELQPVPIAVDETEQRIELTEHGLIRSHRAPTGHTEELSPWQAQAAAMPGEQDGGSQPAEVVASAELDGVRAQLLRHGRLSWLHIDGSGVEATTYSLDTGDGARMVTALGDLLAVEATMRVTAYRDPATITPPTVRNASPVGSTWWPRARIVDSVASAADHTMEAVQVFDVQPAAVPEGLVELDSAAPLWDGLLLRSRLDAAEHQVEIDLDVVDTYAGPGGQVELRYTLRPGDEPGSVLAADTSLSVSEVTVDRNGHLAAAPHTCPYCQQVSCTACPDDTRPCPVCAVPICEPCTAPSSGLRAVEGVALCPACRSMRRPGRLSRLVGRGRTIEATDDVHTVTVTRGDGNRHKVTVKANGQSSTWGLDPAGPGHQVLTKLFGG
ncbi:MAG: helicase-related protein [Acidimicrobiales bacterium]